MCTLALGIGANAAVFSLVDALLLRPLPIQRADEVMAVYQVEVRSASAPNKLSPRPTVELSATAFPTYLDLRESLTSFVSLAAFYELDAGLRVADRTDHVIVGVVTGNYFGTLGLTPQIGRLLVESDEAAPGSTPYAVLSYGLWRRFFGADPDVVGREIHISGHAFTIVGVAPSGFRGTTLSSDPALWVPITMVQSIDPGGLFAANVLDTRAFRWASMIGRLAPGRTATAAQAELNARLRRIVEARPDAYAEHDGVTPVIRAVPVNVAATLPDRETLMRFVAVPLIVAVLTLMIACLNVATLMLGRAIERSRELGVRAALGASHQHLVRQLLVESLVLAGGGAALGLLVARLTTGLLAGFTLPGDIEIASLDLSVNGRFLVFAAAVALLTAAAFSLLPAWRATRTNAMSVLRTEGGTDGTGRCVRPLLVTVQVALSLLLLVGAALFVRSLREALRTDTGFDPDRVAAVSFGLQHHGYDADGARAFWRALLKRVSATPGIEAAALATHVPLSARHIGLPLVPNRHDEAEPVSVPTATNSVAGNYFGVLRIPVVEGRTFGPQDHESAPLVAVVNQAAAQGLWPGDTSAIGNKLRLMRIAAETYTVVGVVAMTKAHSIADEDVPYLYISSVQRPSLSAHEWTNVIARSTEDGRHALAVLESALTRLDAALPVFNKRLIVEQVDAVVMPQRFGSTLLGVFGIVALLVSAVGVYGVVAYAVTQRAFELGVRRALGARAAAVMVAVVRESSAAVVAGILMGLGASMYATRFMTVFLFGIRPHDAAAFGGATLLLASAAGLAALLAAWRVTRIDPMVILRSADERSV